MATAALQPGHLSPASSPRLPSPPPFPEVQIGPKSPLTGAGVNITAQDAEEAALLQSGATRRIRPGTKAADMASGPPVIPLADLDSSFQLQEHLKALYHQATRSEGSTTRPITRETALQLSTPPENVDRSLWLYELCRFLVQKANDLIIGFFADTPPCSAVNCPEMRASEWQYLCAVHDPPKSCCAIDYCCHTLDWAAGILTSQKHFPSRLSLGGDGGSSQSVKQLTNIFRRVYRMFAHAWFQHREVFWAMESQEGLYIFYKTVCDSYSLMQAESYTVPPEAEGLVPTEETAASETKSHDDHPTSVASKPETVKIELLPPKETEDATTILSTAATTRRHKHTPSMGSFVTTIAEGDEELDESKDAHPPAEPQSFAGAVPAKSAATSDVANALHDDPKPREQPREVPREAEEPGLLVEKLENLDLEDKAAPQEPLAEEAAKAPGDKASEEKAPEQAAPASEPEPEPNPKPKPAAEPEVANIDIALSRD